MKISNLDRSTSVHLFKYLGTKIPNFVNLELNLIIVNPYMRTHGGKLMAAGIDDISIYIPRLYVDASDFAEARGLDPEKLQKGLGVSKMAIVDTNQDPACLAANACLTIMKNNKMSPEDI